MPDIQKQRAARTKVKSVREKLAEARQVQLSTYAAAADRSAIDAINEAVADVRKVLDAGRAAALDGGSGIELLDPRLPIALLPVRLETRYAGDRLLIRIFPDDIHVNGHEAAVTAKEADAHKQYWNRLARAGDHPQALKAWETLVATVGLRRALHLATLTDPRAAGSRPGGWSSPARAACLPDRFHACLWWSDPPALAASSPDRIEAAPHLVREPLLLTPDPAAPQGSGNLLGDDAQWLHDFNAAVAAGMALEVRLLDAQTIVHRLVVIGVRASVDADDQAQEFAALLSAHERTSGLDVCPPGVPTNALPGERTPFSTAPSPAAVFDAQIKGDLGPYRRQPPHYASGTGTTVYDERCGSLRLAHALGIAAETLGYTAHGATPTNAASRPVRELLRHLIEPTLASLLGAAVDPQDVAEALDRYVNVPALDDLPALMIGEQPYGVMPVGPRPAASPAGFDRVLDILRERVFAPAIASVPRVRTFSSAGAVQGLLDILRSDAMPRALQLRLALSSALAPIQKLLPGVRSPSLLARDAAAELLRDMGVANPDAAALLDLLFLDTAAVSTLPLVAPDPATAVSADTYLAWLHEELSIEDILNENYRDRVTKAPLPDPKTALFQLCRHAVLEAAHADEMARILAGPATPAYRNDALNHPEYFEPEGRYWTNIAANMASVKEQTSAGGPDAWVPAANMPRTAAVHALLAELRAHGAEPLEAALREAWAMISYRLDAWISADAARRLSAIRADKSLPALAEGYAPGLGIGAFGVVERIDRRAAASAGHVLAPSLAHAAAAGVLLSADLADWAARRGSTYATDLSSARVRLGLELLDGIANGQPLGALLGYRIERMLVDAGGTAPAMIAGLRAIAPINAHRLTAGTEAAETVSANAVVDGWALLAAVTDTHSTTPDAQRLAARLTVTNQSALQAALDAAARAVDGLSDLLLAEGVFQLASGNSARAAAAANAMSGQPVVPNDIEVVRTPLRGALVTHRVLWLFDAPPADAAWDSTPRARCDAAANAWAAFHLPLPGNLWVVARTGTGNREFPLSTLLQGARQAQRSDLTLSALDVVLLADDATPDAAAVLEQRLLALVARQLATDALSLVFDRPASWGADRVSVSELRPLAAALRACLTGLRPLTARELPVAASPHPGDEAARIAAARDALQSVLNRPTASPSDHASVVRAAQLVGIPVQVGDDAAAQAAAVRTEIQARLAANLTGKPWRDQLKALLGISQPALPVWLTAADELQQPFTVDRGATVNDLQAFMSRAARVREKIADVDLALTCRELVTDQARPCAWAVAQTPAAAGERWVGLTGHVPAGRTGIVCLSAARSPGSGSQVTGLFVDEWNEILPADTVQGAVAFHYNAPSSAAPNVILLCLPPSGREQWQLDHLIAAVEDALHRARMRVVDPDLLGAAGQLLPTLLLRDRLLPGSLLRRLAL